jgi:minor histocompatibility antigen H13
MDFMTRLFGRVAYEFTLVQPLIPTYLHVILSAIFAIFIGAHASLSRPSSAAEPVKRPKDADRDDDEEDVGQDETERKMEGMSPIDALTFPLLAGCTLAGLYFLIRWLENPALLNKILNLYFSIFGIISTFRLLTASMGVATSYVFPSAYTRDGKVWRADQKRRKMIRDASPSAENASPLPGWLSTLKFPQVLTEMLWSLRIILSRKLRVRAHVYKTFTANFRIGALDLTGLFLAVVAVAYYNFLDKPWWLTNFLGISFAYNALQLMSPTTFWTGTMILSSLFVYDIYFVFFTPLMVTVAKTIDIPAKLLFPRPSGPDEDPSKPTLAMLGLGDIVLPGIMIGLALRFDLYLFYLRKQREQGAPQEALLDNKGSDGTVAKAEWVPATGNWGERFWIGRTNGKLGLKEQAGVFPKTYFYASLFGYFISMITTLGIMQLYGHAQPALLYLVPGVLGALWGTALMKGDVRVMWEYDEAADDKEKKSIFSPSRLEDLAVKLEPVAKEAGLRTEGSTTESHSDKDLSNGLANDDRKDDLLYFSISLPGVERHKNHRNSTSREKESEENGKLAPRPQSDNELGVASGDEMRAPNVSMSASTYTQGKAQAEEPPGKRQKLA